jgi:hypothetical protein
MISEGLPEQSEEPVNEKPQTRLTIAAMGTDFATATPPTMTTASIPVKCHLAARDATIPAL